MDAAMFAFILAFALLPRTCPMTVGIGTDGALYANRLGWVKISTKTLDSDLRGGCYNDANPIPVTSVKLYLAPNAPKPKVDRVFSILEKEGWSREKVNVQRWNAYPKAPD
jgi:hypothetical protein